MGVQDPLCNAAPTEISGTGDPYPKGSLSGRLWASQCKSCGTRSDRASSTHPRLLQPLVPYHQGNRGVEADQRSILPQCLRALPEHHYGDASVNPRGPTTGPVDRRYLCFCHNGTAWQFTVLPFGLSTSPRVFTKILKPVLAYAYLHRVKVHMYLDDWLLNPGTHQEALEQTSWLKSLCRKLGLVLNLEKSDLIPSQVATYLGIELDTLVGLARPSHKRVTNWLSVAEGFTAQQSQMFDLMSYNTSAIAYLRNQGGIKSLAMSDFSHRHMSVGREEGNDTNSPSPSRTSECVSGPSVPAGSNPQDRMEPKPDHSRQDISCLGQTIRGSVRPKDKHEIGNVHLPHSGGDVMESGQSGPDLGRPVRLIVPSDKPDKGLSKQGQDRKRRDRPDSSRLAQPGVVSGPIRSRDRLSNNSPTSAETAQADLLTPLSSASV